MGGVDGDVAAAFFPFDAFRWISTSTATGFFKFAGIGGDASGSVMPLVSDEPLADCATRPKIFAALIPLMRIRFVAYMSWIEDIGETGGASLEAVVALECVETVRMIVTRFSGSEVSFCSLGSGSNG
jgi:hypothetical protein